ncbi:hypothetical protein [Pseudogracilibacillus auburnensis]|uniref:hypothetical protein n=1 Tax=Pseudogracilibacillus auburnensis TaxID=1494959 RepID=UPI001A973DD1|nr:hypothetical protein [Pseudogracilibacillus auburnensis]MBO1001234.1 hypothetical protein [Pseudogracilibacillus auburnensis]
MKRNKNRLMKRIGWILFLCAIGFFGLQMGYLLIQDRYQVEYIDNRLFYIINIFCVICLSLAILLLLKLTKRFKLIGTIVVGIFMIIQIVLLVDSDRKINNITSVSPNFKHVFSIKENRDSGESFYYRSYYGILARPKESLPYEIAEDYKVEWLAKDVAAFTYETAENTIQQFIATYGDRGGGIAYYYVGAEMQGVWQGENVEVISDPDGITVTENGRSELFEWENIHQFGTLAIVLKKNNEAAWTISLDDNFVVHSDASEDKVGNIRLYKATMEKNQPIKLQYQASY